MLSWGLGLSLLVADAQAGKRRPREPDLQEVAALLWGQALASNEPWEELTYLSDEIGHRLAGSKQLERAIQWGAEQMREDGLRVRLESVPVTHWIRGFEHAEVVAPRKERLDILTLGQSVGTPEGGITADVLVVSSFDELEERTDEAKGRMIVWDVPFTNYGETVAYRVRGATAARKAGGVASLVRSVSPTSLSTPHTGIQRYQDGVDPVPAVAITTEAAAWLHRLQDSGITPRIHLDVRPTMKPMAPSHNVVGEIRGRRKPNEVVLLGCHIDSWDVGQGAQDDGSGCVNVMEVGRLLAALPVRPRRTVRVVLFTNEENGLQGARAYAEAHANELFYAVIEDDSGAGAPLGFTVDTRASDGKPDPERAAKAIASLKPHLTLLESVGATLLEPGGSGADVGGLVKLGAVGFGVRHDMTGYWPIHHTHADTLDKIDPAVVRQFTASTALLTWILAEHPTVLSD